jgi:hypothetical protein
MSRWLDDDRAFIKPSAGRRDQKNTKEFWSGSLMKLVRVFDEGICKVVYADAHDVMPMVPTAGLTDHCSSSTHLGRNTPEMSRESLLQKGAVNRG